MLEQILIIQSTTGINNKLSKEGVIFKASKTFTEAAQYARFLVSYVWVARTLRRTADAEYSVQRQL